MLGDREKDLELLGEGPWDAVLDTCGYLPRIVRRSAEHLAGKAPRYLFVSSISAYASEALPGQTESAPLARMDDEAVEEITGETYGPLKVLCEKAVQEAFGAGAMILRPGLIVGPLDPTDRFSWWPWRLSQEGEVLLPGRPERKVQLIDVRDLAEWMLLLIEQGHTGVLNGAGIPLPMGELVDACLAAGGKLARPVWMSESFLVEQGVAPWTEMPLWMPESEPRRAGFFLRDVSAAVDAGLEFRPLKATVADTLAWLRRRPAGHEWRAGLKPERERELLERWRA